MRAGTSSLRLGLGLSDAHRSCLRGSQAKIQLLEKVTARVR